MKKIINNLLNITQNPDGEELSEIPEILIAEDDEDTRWLIKADLKSECRVVEAKNGKEALKMALEQLPDLVVTDIMMPDINGIELCREIKTNRLTSHIPVIILTAKAAVESQLEGFETGADAYITKPYDINVLKVRIKNLLKTRQQLQMHYAQQVIELEPGDKIESSEPSGYATFSKLQRGKDLEFWEEMQDVLKRRHVEVDFGIDEWAAEGSVSRRSLHRKIKLLTGQTPIQLITEYRITRAAKLLCNESCYITDIAYDVGFGDLSYFNRLFRKKFDMTPSEYRMASKVKGAE